MIETPEIINGPYTIYSTVFYAQASTDNSGCNMEFYFNDELIGEAVIDLFGVATLTLEDPLAEIGSLKTKVVCELESSEFSEIVVVAGPTTDVEIRKPVVFCDETGLNIQVEISNLGPDRILSGNVITLTTEGIPTTPTITSTGHTFDENGNLILGSDFEEGDVITISYLKASYDCGTPIPCITIEVNVPVSYSNVCSNNKTQCVKYLPPKSPKPVLNTPNVGESTVSGIGCAGGLITALFINNVRFEKNIEIDIESNFIVPLTNPILSTDIIQVSQTCESQSESDRSDIIAPNDASFISKLCINGVRIRGMEGQTYEVQAYNYTRNVVLGRRTFTGSQFNVSIPYNSLGLLSTDLQPGDIVGVRMVDDCCPPIESAKKVYNPLRTLNSNKSCDILLGGTIEPTFLGGIYPIIINVKKNGLSVAKKTLSALIDSTLVSGIPNGTVEVEVIDRGGCSLKETVNFSCAAQCVGVNDGSITTISGSYAGTPGSQFIFQITGLTGTPPYDIEWNGGGASLIPDNTLPENQIKFSFPSTGTYSVTAVVSNCGGGISKTLQRTIVINSSGTPPPPSCNPVSGGSFNNTVDTYNVSPGTTLEFLTRNLNGDSPFTYQYSCQGATLISGGGSGDDYVTYTFNSVGQFYPQVRVFNCNGSYNIQLGKTVNVSISTPPTPPPPPPPPPPTPPPPTPPSCSTPSSVTLSGNFSPSINTSETYGFSASGGSNNIIAWSVQGGTINGSNTGSTCSVDWGSDSSGLSSITVQLGCVSSGDIASDYEFFYLSGGTPPPPTPPPTPPTPPPPPPPPPPSETTYYELAGCGSSDYAWTTINPAGGTGQRYVLPGVEPTFFTYTGSSNAFAEPPSGHNGSIQIASGETGCP